MSRLSDVQIDGQGREGTSEGSARDGWGEKYEAGLKKKGDGLSAFLLAAKLRIDVSRSIQRLAAPRRVERTARCAARFTPVIKKKKKKKEKKWYTAVSESGNCIAESMRRNIPPRKLIHGRREARELRVSRGIRFRAV